MKSQCKAVHVITSVFVIVVVFVAVINYQSADSCTNDNNNHPGSKVHTDCFPTDNLSPTESRMNIDTGRASRLALMSAQ